MDRGTRWLVVACVALAAPSIAAAEIHLDVEALTDFPIDVGARVSVELPLRLRVGTSLGFLPGPYVDAINDVAVGLGAYTTSEGQLIRAALQTSLVWRVAIGWRPFALHGFYFDLGYGLVSLGGGASTAELIAGVTGKPAPAEASNDYSYAVGATVQMLDAELGWPWIVWRGLTLRAALGFAGTVAAHTTITPEFTPRSPNAQAQFTSYAASYLDQTLTSYVFTPVITVAAGWRFF